MKSGIYYSFSLSPIGDGIKYLGSRLKPNSYTMKDWDLIIIKCEARIYNWMHRWLSKGGKMIW